MRPALPRYNVRWNVDIVLNYLRTRTFELNNFVTCISQVVNVTCTIVWTERLNTTLVRHKKYLYVRWLCENLNWWPFKNIKSRKTYWGVKFPSLPKWWKIVYCPSYETLSGKNKRSEKKYYHFIYCDAETPQRGCREILSEGGWNQSWARQESTSAYSNPTAQGRHPAVQHSRQTPDGYCSKDCLVENWQCFQKISK